MRSSTPETIFAERELIKSLITKTKNARLTIVNAKISGIETLLPKVSASKSSNEPKAKDITPPMPSTPNPVIKISATINAIPKIMSTRPAWLKGMMIMAYSAITADIPPITPGKIEPGFINS